jgi:hypothetical protein
MERSRLLAAKSGKNLARNAALTFALFPQGPELLRLFRRDVGPFFGDGALHREH